ncbi:four helix bundle protein [Mucilaginibacter frigoritolerans]|jgi:four helix bundle protein|uniref:Four helix bundle protein n=1 Tax=Mucilaginibacter frigoritolerans TaxID=652788 RepID=A0A562U4R4_9SPHI|nr:four helix bundle protein [Mucilaginibacter frigoritolerans]TWJ00823.1 four helix bundle protein [Mucilaginibacter frigoritolerans]
MRDFKKLEVWKKSHELNLFVYSNLLPKFPLSEHQDLLSQTKKAAFAISSNIVKGCGKFREVDFALYLEAALGAVYELEFCCLLSSDLAYFNSDEQLKTTQLLDEVKAMLIGIIRKINNKRSAGDKRFSLTGL